VRIKEQQKHDFNRRERWTEFFRWWRIRVFPHTLLLFW